MKDDTWILLGLIAYGMFIGWNAAHVYRDWVTRLGPKEVTAPSFGRFDGPPDPTPIDATAVHPDAHTPHPAEASTSPQPQY